MGAVLHLSQHHVPFGHLGISLPPAPAGLLDGDLGFPQILRWIPPATADQLLAKCPPGLLDEIGRKRLEVSFGIEVSRADIAVRPDVLQQSRVNPRQDHMEVRRCALVLTDPDVPQLFPLLSVDSPAFPEKDLHILFEKGLVRRAVLPPVGEYQVQIPRPEVLQQSQP